MAANETPLMKQYKEIKSQYNDSILFFRLGDFYEMFFEDAKLASRELGLTLTSRNREKGEEIPLAGLPYHSSASYIARLVAKGYKVAICEQMEDPKLAKGIVKREVTQVITPGTIIDTDYIDDRSNNFLLGIEIDKAGGAVAYLDITTGEFRTTQFTGTKYKDHLLNEIFKLSPKEIISEPIAFEALKKELEYYKSIKNVVINEYKPETKSEEYLKEYFGVVSLESFGIADKAFAIKASALVLSYALDMQKNNEIPVNRLSYVNTSDIMELSLSTQKNLELVENERNREVEGTLLWVLDSTKTAMGARLLKRFIRNPLTKVDAIVERQSHVTFYMDEVILREEAKEELKEIYDIERLVGKLILGTENGRDLVALKKSLVSAEKLAGILGEKCGYINKIETVKGICGLIEKAIVDEPPFSIREGDIIKKSYNEPLDELHKISSSGKDYILEMEQKERENSGIKSLKVGYNKVFGYYIDVTKPNLHMVPDYFIRKQTVATGERFITPELKEYENKILTAKEKIEALEYELFKDVSAKIKDKIEDVQGIAEKIASIDAFISLADAAVKNDYVKPEITDGFELEIEDARHPVVEKLLGSHEFISNSVSFDENERIHILTGPNMAGKSTFMKQIALIVLMAQTGSYVPASRAKIGAVDKIFTRVGASDDLMSGQSTFMVEMSEVANIINNATERSFIILDEVGRGTSTFDGISIAWAITEHLSAKIKAKTIFATHYHELTELERQNKNIVNYRVDVKENPDSVIFLRKIVRGGADKSFGIEVAKLAGLPSDILNKSRKILFEMEKKRDLGEKKYSTRQLSLFENREIPKEPEPRREDVIIAQILELDVNNLTPIEALIKLNEIKRRLTNV